jgi:lysophospholipase L1-like esterase
MRIRPSRRRIVSSLVALLTVGAVASSAAAAQPAGQGAFKVDYLALGDSVAFGYVPPEAVPAPNYLDPHSFVGYPELLAKQLNMRLTNASCPGETTASLLSVSAQSNGCENAPGSTSGYRTLFPLHVHYPGSQDRFALRYLSRHNHTRLITIDIGANDAFVCQETTQDHCASQGELQMVAAQIAANLGTLFGQIRDVAHYRGRLVALSYYALNYADPSSVAGSEFLNGVITAVTQAYGGIVADGFGAFENASASFGGDPCAAGLLIKLPDGTCNIHPSQEGHTLLAGAIATAIGR